MRNVVMNKNHAQLALYKSGLKETGLDAVRGKYSDVEIRKAGARRLARRTAGAVLAAAGVVGTAAGFGYEISRMPAPPTEQSVQHDMHKSEMQQGELTPEQLQAKHQIDVREQQSEEQAVAVQVKH